MGEDRQQREYPRVFPAQQQPRHPGIESVMVPRPIFDHPERKGSGRLQNKVALITGGDSGIGRAIAIAYAKEGADLVIVYLDEHEDAAETKRYVESYGARCLLIAGDIGYESVCRQVVAETIRAYGKLDVLVNNAGMMIVRNSLEEIPEAQIERIFRTNVFAQLFLSKAALPHLKEGSSIINTASITAYVGYPNLIEYSASKGAVVSFTRALSLSLVDRGIRVNGVAPGPIWTPLIPSSGWDPEAMPRFGHETPMKRAGQPVELAPAYVFLASDESSYMTGQMLHVNGGMAVGG